MILQFPERVISLRSSESQSCSRWSRRGLRQRGITLLELLVVLGIIGLVASISLPALKGLGQSNKMASANQQLLSDIAAARRIAIKDRTDVYMIFMPPADPTLSLPNGFPGTQKTNLLTGQQTSYALYVSRNVGDQPGRHFPRYVSEWRHLPDGVIIPTWAFTGGTNVPYQDLNPRFIEGFIYTDNNTDKIPIPTEDGVDGDDRFWVPYIQFDHTGGLAPVHTTDAVVPLAFGSVFYAREASGELKWTAADVAERPPNNSIDNYNLIVIDKLTGRTRLERPGIR